MTTDEFADEIVGRCRERMERGETVDPEEVIRAHPEVAAALRERFAALALLDAALARPPEPPPGVPPLAGRRIGGWRIESLLGAGGMGAVWLGIGDDGARAAVKVLHPHLAPRTRSAARFLREAELGRRVRHTNVVRTLDAGEQAEPDATLRYLVMEHVEGRTLRSLLDDGGRQPEQLCRYVGREIARGLAAIHEAGAVHRDLKPENVIITRCVAPGHEDATGRPAAQPPRGGGVAPHRCEQVVKLMDLGVAHVHDEAVRLSQTGAFVGSLRHAAPEQLLAAADVDARADLHALGVLLYEMATGLHPFRGDDVGAVVRRILDETPRRAGAVEPQLSPFLEELLAQLLEKDREKRPAGAAEVAAILDECEASAWWRRRAEAIRAATHRPLRRIRIPRETALIGRDPELALLRSLFERASKGDGQVALVEGEAGIGKSRLVDEFVAGLAAAGEEVEFLCGSWAPGGAASAAGALAGAFRERFGDEGLEEALRAELGEAEALAPAFAALLRGFPAPPGSAPLTKDAITTCFVRVTQSLAARRTTIVLADDLHFAPMEGRALFASLALAVPGHRVLLVGTARPELDARWSDQVARRGAARIPLARLGAKDLVALLRDALRSAHLAEQLGVKIAEKSDGNPYFAFEILRGLREGKFLVRRPDGTWVTTREIRDIDVPPSIVEVVQARVADLERADVDVLEVAACIGFEFDDLLVGAVLGVPAIPLLQRLGAIERRHRLVRSVGRRFEFDHHQVQEVLYAGLSEPLREAYHLGVADAIEARHGAAAKPPEEVGGAVCVELAEQFLLGAAGDRALRYLDAGTAHLQRNYLGEALVRLTDRALAVPGLLTGRRRSETILGTLNSLDVLGRREEEADAIRELKELAGTDEGLLAWALLGSCRQLLTTARFDEACGVLREALTLFRRTGDRRGEAKALATLGETLQSLGRLAEAVPLIESGLAMSRELGDGAGERNAIERLAITLCDLDRYAEAGALFREVREMYRAIGDRRSEGLATHMLGTVEAAFGHHEEAIACHEAGIAAARAFGDRRGEAGATCSLANTLAAMGRNAEARVLMERQIALAREVGDRRSEAIALVNLGSMFIELGQVEKARDALVPSLALCRETGSRYPEGYALHLLAQVAGESGDDAEAIRLFEEAIALRRTIGHSNGLADTLFELGVSRQDKGDLDAARAAYEEGLALVTKAGRPVETLFAKSLLATLPGGDLAAAVAELKAAPELAFPGLYWILWRASGDRSLLVEAKAMLDRYVANAPADCRESMVRNHGVHREIEEAARAAGL